MQGVRRMMSLYWPSYKRMKLSGIRQADGATYCSPQEVQQALKDYWGPVYADKPFDADLSNKFLKSYCDRNRHLFNFSNLELPEVNDFDLTISKLRDSACGPDGIPYSAYKACRPLAAEVFANSVASFATPEEPAGLELFNRQLVWFAPKAALDDDQQAVFRAPNQLRTIFGSNTDSKIFNSTIAYKFTPPYLGGHP